MGLFKRITIKWKMIFLIVPLTFIPTMIMLSVVIVNIFKNIEDKNYRVYKNTLTELSYNIDKYFLEYINVLSTIFVLPKVQEVFSLKEFHNEPHEHNITRELIGDNTLNRGGLLDFVTDKIKGDLVLYESDKKSLMSKTDYKYYCTQSNVAIPEYDKMINDPLFLKLVNDKDKKNIVGKLQENVITGYQAEKKTVIILPYQKELQEISTKFIVLILNADYWESLYRNIEILNYGTLYILDENDNILDCNHPSSYDLFDYDSEKKQYIKEDSDYNFDDDMNYNDYCSLNTDLGIINNSEVIKIIKNQNVVNKKQFIKYKDKTYLTLFFRNGSSKTKLLFFFLLFNFKNRLLML